MNYDPSNEPPVRSLFLILRHVYVSCLFSFWRIFGEQRTNNPPPPPPPRFDLSNSISLQQQTCVFSVCVLPLLFLVNLWENNGQRTSRRGCSLSACQGLCSLSSSHRKKKQQKNSKNCLIYHAAFSAVRPCRSRPPPPPPPSTNGSIFLLNPSTFVWVLLHETYGRVM